jgi:hypothetical protein
VVSRDPLRPMTIDQLTAIIERQKRKARPDQAHTAPLTGFEPSTPTEGTLDQEKRHHGPARGPHGQAGPVQIERNHTPSARRALNQHTITSASAYSAPPGDHLDQAEPAGDDYRHNHRHNHRHLPSSVPAEPLGESSDTDKRPSFPPSSTVTGFRKARKKQFRDADKRPSFPPSSTVTGFSETKKGPSFAVVPLAPGDQFAEFLGTVKGPGAFSTTDKAPSSTVIGRTSAATSAVIAGPVTLASGEVVTCIPTFLAISARLVAETAPGSALHQLAQHRLLRFFARTLWSVEQALDRHGLERPTVPGGEC